MDGLLLDTENIYSEVTQQIVQRYGSNFDWSLKKKIMGRRALESAQIIVETLDLPITAEEYLKERNEILLGRIAECKLIPGVEKLTRYFTQEGIPQAVATSSKKDTLEVKKLFITGNGFPYFRQLSQGMTRKSQKANQHRIFSWWQRKDWVFLRKFI